MLVICIMMGRRRDLLRMRARQRIIPIMTISIRIIGLYCLACDRDQQRVLSKTAAPEGRSRLNPEYIIPLKISSSQSGARMTTDKNRSSMSVADPLAEVSIVCCHSVISGRKNIREFIKSAPKENTAVRRMNSIKVETGMFCRGSKKSGSCSVFGSISRLC